MTITDTAAPVTETTTAATLAALQEERDTLLTRCADKTRELEEFKARVGRLAMERAREHGWCTVVQNTLEELDVPVPPQWHSFDVVLRVRMTAINESQRDATESFISDSLRAYDSEGSTETGEHRLTLRLDSDWSSSVINNVAVDYVDNVEDVED